MVDSAFGVSGTRSCRWARALAECTCMSHFSQRYALSAPQYQRALLFMHTSQARDACPAIAIAVTIDLQAVLVVISTVNLYLTVLLSKSECFSPTNGTQLSKSSHDHEVNKIYKLSTFSKKSLKPAMFKIAAIVLFQTAVLDHFSATDSRLLLTQVLTSKVKQTISNALEFNYINFEK